METSRIEMIHGEEMREQVIEIIVDALQRQGIPGMTRDSVRIDAAHREAFLAMLDDCRPLPVILALKQDLRAGRL
ncbi:MAG: hypothetical protein ABI369_02095 [Acetobacteraceae bacterium]